MLTIEVTQEDIDEGEEGDVFFCPVARAARRSCAPFGYSAVSAGAKIGLKFMGKRRPLCFEARSTAEGVRLHQKFRLHAET